MGGRIADVRTALWVAFVDTATVGCWFALVVIESRTVFTALAGLSVLCFGALLRTGLIATSLDQRYDAGSPRWMIVSGGYAAIWLSWLLVAEAIGGRYGLLLAGAALVAALAVHFSIAYRLATPRSALVTTDRSIDWSLAVGPAIALASGATVLLGFVWFADAPLYSTTLAVGTRTIVFETNAALNGVAVLGCCSFLATHRMLSVQTAW